jgi:hypothetical protein
VLRSITVAGLALALAGCSSAGDGGGAAPTPDGTPTSSASSSGEPTATGSSDSTEPADAAAYLPVPDGRELTPPGTELGFKEPALAAWTPRQGLVGVVGVQVQRVERTTVDDSLAGYELTPEESASTPYFVTVEVGNGGDTDLGGRQLPVYVVDSEQRLVAPTGIDPAFEPCPGSVLPAVFAPGDETRSCLIFLVAPGAELEQVMFRPPEGVVPITWTGKVQRLEDRNRPRRDRDRRGESRQPRDGRR